MRVARKGAARQVRSTMPEVIYVDVDDTLVRWAGSKPIPIPAVIAKVRRLYAAGATLYCWSAAGGDLARDVATRLGIADLFVAFLPKPTLLIDDQPLSAPRLHPTECDDA